MVREKEMMKHALLILMALIAGAAGGAVGAYAVFAHERGQPTRVIRAQRFELVNDAAQTTSFWGVDEAKEVVLAFALGRAVVASDGMRSHQLAMDKPYVQRTTIGMLSDGSPLLRFTGTDTHSRIQLDLDDFERPSLWMSDGKGAGLTLGSVRSDTPAIRDKTERWVLNFLPEDTTRVGIFTEQVGSQNYVRGFSFINPKKVKYP